MESVALMLQMSMPQQQVVGPKQRPNHYKSVVEPEVQFQGQANDLTEASARHLSGRIKVIAANEALYDQWKAAAGAKNGTQAPAPSPSGGMAAAVAQNQALNDKRRPTMSIPEQISGDHVSVATMQAQAPLVKIEKGRLTGDQGVIQAYAAADRLYSMEAGYLGRDIKFPTSDGKLHVQTEDVSAMQSGPSHRAGTILIPPGDKNSLRDADTISHEGGHAVLRAQRPDYGTHLPLTGEAEALHEGFADSTALIASLQDKQVRADVIARRQQGNISNMASNIAEGTSRTYDATLVEDHSKPLQPGGFPATRTIEPDARHGLRDLAATPPRPGQGPKDMDGTEEPHEASTRFSSSFYRSVLDISDALKQKTPGISDDDALKQARDIAGKDLARATDFLPVLPQGGTQSDLARAVVSADRRDHDGQYGAIYAKNFTAAGLEAEPSAQRAGLEGLRLPGAMATAKPFEVPEGARRPVAGSGRAMADQFVKDNAATLQLDQGVTYRAQQMVHNDQGETFITFSDGRSSQDGKATHFLRLGFDRDGQVITESRATAPRQTH